jgi:osmotically-inducible protein OsmY
MSRNRASTIDIDLQLRVQIALDQWAHRASTNQHEYILAIANELGEVTLRGHVDGRHVSEQAMQVVERVPGVHLVFNHIATMSDHRSLSVGLGQKVRGVLN